MQRRTIAILLVAIGALLILAVLVWLFLGNRRSTQQPPPIQPSPTIRTSPEPNPTSTASVPAIPQSERELQDRLKRQASDFAARMMSYASLDEFMGMKSVYVNAQPAVQAFLEGERKKLIAAHPAIGPSWGQTSRALTSKITSPLPLGAKTEVQLTVQVQQTIEDGANTEVQYAEVDMTLQWQDKTWVVSRVSAKPITL
ncbi:hypothetical protein FJZ48_00425 [Candidatus Uhrbacteria bacterium]|nr:hypothetical protein [Candidatus Uhrbacteria bacterium]